MVKKVCIVTGTRADYGLLRWVMDGVSQSERLQLQIIATGMHLSPEFGMTVNDIELDGFMVDKRVEMLISADTPSGISKSMGLGMIGMADALADLQPDLLLLLGDRFEIFAAAATALVARIPIAHLHGGEVTEGAIDESIRHSITKMSHIHFVANESYRKRVIQLGEDPSHVYCVGGLGLDNLLRMDLLDREALEDALDFRLGPKNLLVTFHPPTLEKNAAIQQMQELLSALNDLKDTHLIFTMPNADTEGRALIRMISDFCANHSNAKAYTSLGQLRYLSCINHVDGVVGNSSSGLIEVPALGKGTINLGDRQKGRIKATSVIECQPEKKDILEAVERLYSNEFLNSLQTVVNPYGTGGASETIVQILEEKDFQNILKKPFHDIFVNHG